MDSYTEMKEVPELRGSLNAIVSEVHHMRRPPSLSESCAWNPENVERAMRLAGTGGTHAILFEAPAPPTAHAEFAKKSWEFRIINTALKLIFHITLISVFEGMFFFQYVSQLESAGIQSTAAGFINDATSACASLVPWERTILNDLITPFINTTNVIAEGNRVYAARTVTNTALLNQSWIYVGTLSSLFLLTTIFAKCRRVQICWGPMLAENFAMVFLLALYEFAFFRTIVFPYEPLSAAEIAKNAVEQLHSTCGIFGPTGI